MANLPYSEGIIVRLNCICYNKFSCEIKANKSLFVLGLNKRWSDSPIGV